MPLQFPDAGDREIDVHLHRYVVLRPSRTLQPLDLLECQLAAAVGVDED
jgi:hypothetical protein